MRFGALKTLVRHHQLPTVFHRIDDDAQVTHSFGYLLEDYALTHTGRNVRQVVQRESVDNPCPHIRTGRTGNVVDGVGVGRAIAHDLDAE